MKLAVTEIRQFGASSPQVARRMRAMLKDVMPQLPARALVLEQEVELLKGAVDHKFLLPQD